MMMKRVIGILLLFVLYSCQSENSLKTGMEGKPLPSFSIFLPDSATYFNTKDIPEGRPIVVFSFGAHCPYSRAQMAEILDNIQSLKDIQFCIVTTSPFIEMKDFYNEYNLKKYSNVVVGVDYTNFFSSYYQAPGVPCMAIYNKSRKLNKTILGKTSGSKIKAISYM